jgi:hypothetical protein
VPEVPAPAPVPHDPVDAVLKRSEEDGLGIHARTACAGWLGERLDVGWAIDVLHPLANPGLPPTVMARDRSEPSPAAH